ncbi:galactose-specific lectin nattectin-like isoform X5 [Halichoeres trimaculatus]|uniref:galactose-specific lectin nattectin-like isoform X4 n=1 Tax=Halichoeres trimaculatus TaxID=147232 RepID=UPI003D9F63A1
MSVMKILVVAQLVCALMLLSGADAYPEPDPEPEPEPGPEPEPEVEPVEQEGAPELVKRTLSCPSGWTLLSERCFCYDSSYRTWAQAERNCQALGGNLASVHSAAEYHNIQWLVTTMSYKHGLTWLGASDAAEEGTWLWTDGTSYNYKYYGGFDNAGSKQHCLQMNWGEHKYWDDVECYNKLPSVCSRKANKSA